MSNKKPPNVAPEAVMTALLEMHLGLITLLVGTRKLGLNELQMLAQIVPANIEASDADPRFKAEAAGFAKAVYANLPWKEWEALASGKSGKPS
jgi:hypothetical protein